MIWQHLPSANMFQLILVLSIAVCVLSSPKGARISRNVNNVYLTEQNIIAEGYQAETHHVTTTDGYILEMHRIPYARYQSEATGELRPVVFLMHGLLSASNAFIVTGSEYSIGYVLADAGFDVWMGNARGNKNSRYHLTLNPDEEPLEFFDFTWEEIGLHDVSAMIDYILEYTERTKLHYIGHSQGGTVFLVLTSMRPEYNQKIASAHLLAGVGYQDYFPDPMLRGIAWLTDIIWVAALAAGNIEVFPPTTNITTEGDYRQSDHCFGDVKLSPMCELTGIRQLMRQDDDEVSEESEAGGGSLKQVGHYGQNIRDSQFRRWNYGIRQNTEIYGSASPPPYDLGLITTNVTMHYTVSDNLLDERDVLAMVADMPNTVARKVARESFLHADFAVATDAKELVTDFIVEAIKYVEKNPPAEVPDDTSEEPDNTNEKPGDTNEIPDDTNEKPGDTNEVPDSTSEEPDNTNEKPGDTNEVPDSTSEELDNTNEKPGDTNELPDHTSDEPVDTSDIDIVDVPDVVDPNYPGAAHDLTFNLFLKCTLLFLVYVRY